MVQTGQMATPDELAMAALQTDDFDTLDSGFLQRLVDGDQVAFWSLWEQYQHEFFYRYCLRLMQGNHEDAEDVLYSASLKAWQRLPLYAPEITHIKAWLIRLIQNHCIDVRRARDRQQRSRQQAEALDDTWAMRNGSTQESAEDTVLRREMIWSIQQAVDRLPTRLREPCRLRFFDDLSCRDIADQLHLSTENVRKRLQQARLLLQASLQDYLYGWDSRKGVV